MNARTGVALTLLAGALSIACAPTQWLLPKVGLEVPGMHEFGPGFKAPVSVQTNEPVTGFGGNGGGVHRTPLIFVHGTTTYPSFFKDARAYYKSLGYTDDELWALGYGWSSGRYLDSPELSAVTLDRFVTEVLRYLSEKTGRPIRQVDIIGHSLGVSVTRQWVKQANAFHKLHSFIANAGVNHGSPIVLADGRGPNREVNYSLSAGSPWLAALNRGSEIPGPTRYMAMYDGTGWGDVFYPPPFEDSPRLEGAHNVAYNREHGTLIDHLELMIKHSSLDLMHQWLRQGREPLPQAEPPSIVQQGALLSTSEPGAMLHCATGENYPDINTPGVASLDISGGQLHSCYAKSTRSLLPSVLLRYRYREGPPKAEPLVVSATPAGGVFEHPLEVKLSASDPDAFIVYSTVSADVNSGAPLYSPEHPIYLVAPVTMTARAYAPDGRVSAPLKLRFDISVELIDARHTLERQFDPSVEPDYKGQRRVGR